MIEHKFSNSGVAPFGMRKQIRDVGFIVRYIRYHESKPDNNVTIKYDTAEIGILETLGHYKYKLENEFCRLIE